MTAAMCPHHGLPLTIRCADGSICFLCAGLAAQRWQQRRKDDRRLRVTARAPRKRRPRLAKPKGLLPAEVVADWLGKARRVAA